MSLPWFTDFKSVHEQRDVQCRFSGAASMRVTCLAFVFSLVSVGGLSCTPPPPECTRDCTEVDSGTSGGTAPTGGGTTDAGTSYAGAMNAGPVPLRPVIDFEASANHADLFWSWSRPLTTQSFTVRLDGQAAFVPSAAN